MARTNTETRNLIKTKKYFLFDLDGTMVNLENMNYVSFRDAISELANKNLTYDEYMKYFAGAGSLAGFEKYSLEKHIALRAETLVKAYRSKKEEALKTRFKEVVKIKSGIAEFLEVSRKDDIMLAVATSTVKKFAMYILKEAGLVQYFDAIVTVNDVVHTKPNPEIFFIAMELVGGNINDSVIFEDSPSGVQCAKNSGMDYVIVVTPGHNEHVVGENDYIISDYTELI
jgi:HAD superfamily hydrolase (TIGR01509 family)